jgi:hypothetical protein
MNPIRSQSVVRATGKLANGEKIFQEIPITHDVGAPDSAILARGFQLVQQVGGLLKEAGDKMKFYASGVFPDGIEFEVKKVQLVQPSVSL